MGLSTMTALAINFATDLSVILGAIIVLAVDVSAPITSTLLLAFGGDIYLQIGCVKYMPKLINSALPPRRTMFCVLFFIVRVTIIGFVLLDHEHYIVKRGGHGRGH